MAFAIRTENNYKMHALPDFESRVFAMWKSPIGLWPGPKWAGFGQTGLLKTGFNTKRFTSVWVASKTGLNRVITRVNKKQMGWKKTGFYPGENTI
jgi:hypothetical protein